jgi:cobalt-zinc-cadmium efflux system membrane fusion protein
VDATDGTAVLSTPAAVEADPARVDNILAPLTGRVMALKVRLGQHVVKGQPLLVLASGDFAQATSDAEKARDALDLAKKALERARGVQAAGGSATKDVEAAQSSYGQAEAELTRARARLYALSGGAGGADLVLKAPQHGVVTTLAIASGAVVSDPTATLMTVTNIDRVFVTANLAEGEIGRIGPGTAADMVLTDDPAHPLHGRVSEIDAVVQPDTRRQRVRIAVPNPGGRLLPNMYATVRFAVPAPGGVTVPQSALLMNNDTTSVLVEVRPWVFQRRAVKLGDETDSVARVLNGLSAGERVVVRGGVLLND